MLENQHDSIAWAALATESFFDSRALWPYYCAPMQKRPSMSSIAEYVDARKAFVQHAQIEGLLALEKLTRAADILADKEGQLQASLSFSTTEDGIKRIRGSISAQVNAVCQRCLHPVEVAVEDQINLVMAMDDEKARLLEQRLDKDVDLWVSDAEKISIAELLEDQLILSLPIASYHELAQCRALGYGNEQGDESELVTEAAAKPFAVLAQLLDNKSETKDE